jgi:hypothetical protein
VTVGVSVSSNMRSIFVAGILAAAGVSHSARADLTVAAPAPQPIAPAQPVAAPAPIARPSTPAPDANASSDTRWYGWQSFAAGGAGATLIFIGGLTEMTGTNGDGTVAAYVWGGLIYGLGPFGVHMAHDSVPKALGALAILAGVPLTGFAIGLGVGKAECSTVDCRARSADWGALAGVLAAPLVDGLALGWTKHASSHHAASDRGPKLAMAPVVAPTKGGMTVSMGGTF